MQQIADAAIAVIFLNIMSMVNYTKKKSPTRGEGSHEVGKLRHLRSDLLVLGNGEAIDLHQFL